MRFGIILIPLFLAILSSSCTSFDFSQRRVQQGTSLSARKIDGLKIGMSKSEVATLMGTSLISPMFNHDRWDYAYTFRKGYQADSIKHLVLYFKNDTLNRIER